MSLFKYQSPFSNKECESSISREMAEALADADANCMVWGKNNDFGSLPHAFYSDNYGKVVYPVEIKSRHYDPKVFAMADGLPRGWESDVYAVKSERMKAAAEAKLVEAYSSFEAPPAIKAALSSILDERPRGIKAPERSDLSGLKPVRGREYKPAGGCGAKLKLKEAIHYCYSQESYSDDSRYLIPVEGEVGDPSVCRSNLGKWCEAIRSHNGFAGSGSSYSAELVVSDLGAYVVLYQRASICD